MSGVTNGSNGTGTLLIIVLIPWDANLVVERVYQTVYLCTMKRSTVLQSNHKLQHDKEVLLSLSKQQ